MRCISVSRFPNSYYTKFGFVAGNDNMLRRNNFRPFRFIFGSFRKNGHFVNRTRRHPRATSAFDRPGFSRVFHVARTPYFAAAGLILAILLTAACSGPTSPQANEGACRPADSAQVTLDSLPTCPAGVAEGWQE